MTKHAEQTSPNFKSLLESALREPGTISEAYTAFHGYSLGNQLLALFECHARGLQPGPIATYRKWQERGRQVRKGERAISLCMPITMTRVEPKPDDPNGEPQIVTFRRFVFRPRWFVLAQTDGADYQPDTVADWSKTRALQALDITEQPFDLVDGNVQGYARQRTVAVSPVAAHPIKTLFHEIAHVVLGHTTQGELRDDERTPRNIAELEAEGTAMLVSAALGIGGLEYCRGYMQHWYRDGRDVPEKSAARIFAAADKILRAGRGEPLETQADA